LWLGSIVDSSDVKRGQNLEAETEAKDKVMNKKYQIMIDNIQLNLSNHGQNDTLKFLILSRTVTVFYHLIVYRSVVSQMSVLHLRNASDSKTAFDIIALRGEIILSEAGLENGFEKSYVLRF